MSAEPSNVLPERSGRLLLLAASPTIWGAHFLLSYCTAAVWCEKFASPAGSLAAVRIAIAAFTAVALIAIGIIGWIGWRRHTHGGAALPHDDDSPADRHRFLGFATALLSGLSAVAVLFAALAAAFVETCA